MSYFHRGFASEITKLAQMLTQKKDESPVATAGKNLGISTAAGQPEQPAGTVAKGKFKRPTGLAIPKPPKLAKPAGSMMGGVKSGFINKVV